MVFLAGTKPPDRNANDDQPFWHNSSNGTFTVKAAYNFLGRSSWDDETPKWSIIWKIKVPHKIQVFLWLLSKGALMTNTRRKLCRFTECSKCDLCPHEDESWIHLMRDCVDAVTVWTPLLPPTSISYFFTEGAESWLERNLSDNSDSSFGIPWNCIFGVTCWLIWKWRNERIFEGKTQHRKHVMARTLAEEYFRILGIINTGQDRGRPDTMEPDGIMEEGSIRINTDGAASLDLENVACGGILRDSQGNLIVAFAERICSCPVIQSELKGIQNGLELAWSLGARKIQLECDSLLAIDLVRRTGITNDPSWHTLKAIKRMLTKGWSVSIRHIPRSNNIIADQIAKTGKSLNFGFHIFHKLPPDLYRLVQGELTESEAIYV